MPIAKQMIDDCGQNSGSGRLSAGQRRRQFCAILQLVVAVVLLNSATVQAQDYSSIGVQRSRNARSSTLKFWSSKTEAARRTEGKLAKQPAAELQTVKTLEQLVSQLAIEGYSVVVESSVLDDAGLDAEIESPRNAVSIYRWLSSTLASCNTSFAVTRDGVIQLVSMDDKEDTVFHQTIFYRVNDLAPNLKATRVLALDVTESVSPDTWQDAGGMCVIVPRMQNGNRLLIVSAHYSIHNKLEAFLVDLGRAGGARVSGVVAHRAVGRQSLGVVSDGTSKGSSSVPASQAIQPLRRAAISKAPTSRKRYRRHRAAGWQSGGVF